MSRHLVNRGPSGPGAGFDILPFALSADPPATGQGWTDPSASDVAMVQALDRVSARGVHVVNLSVGGLPRRFDPGDPVATALEQVHRLGITVVVAAGNAGPRAGTMCFEARAPSVIAVGAADTEGRALRFSSRGGTDGRLPDVLADPVSSLSRRQGSEKIGTSFAAPKVAKLAGVVRSMLQWFHADLAHMLRGDGRALCGPVEVPVIGIIDRDIDARAVQAAIGGTVAREVYGGRDYDRVELQAHPEWLSALRDLFVGAKARFSVDTSPAAIRRVLAAAAVQQEAEPTTRHGCLREPALAGLLAEFGAARIAALFGTGGTVPARDLAEFDAEHGPLWPRDELEAGFRIFYEANRLVLEELPRL